jgi:hypothetical protein
MGFEARQEDTVETVRREEETSSQEGINGGTSHQIISQPWVDTCSDITERIEESVQIYNRAEI